MNRKSQPSSGTKSAWPGHLLIAFMACMWLVVTEYSIDVPFIAVVGGIALLVLSDGAVNSYHSHKLVEERGAQEREHDRKLKDTALEVTQLAKMSPALRRAFAVLYPALFAADFSDHYFAEWLEKTLRNPNANLLAWMRAYHYGGTYCLPPLEGLYDHLERTGNSEDDRLKPTPQQLQAIKDAVESEVRIGTGYTHQLAEGAAKRFNAVVSQRVEMRTVLRQTPPKVAKKKAPSGWKPRGTPSKDDKRTLVSTAAA